MTHDELVRLAANWIRKKNHPIVLQDVKCQMTSEQPDVIAWGNSGFSTLIEVKVSLSDLVRDKDKSFRRNPASGMGFYRWYAFPKLFTKMFPGALDTYTPGFWGIVEIDDEGRAKQIRKPQPYREWNQRCERALLVNALRKATEGWGRRTFGDIAPEMKDGDPHPTASRIIKDLVAENHILRKAAGISVYAKDVERALAEKAGT